MKKWNCLVYSETFRAKSIYGKKCSSKYVQEWKHMQRAKMNVQYNCERCNGLFWASKINDKYCSDACSKKPLRSNTDYAMFLRDNFTCIYCGKSSIEHGVKLEVEHITPILLGGLTTIDNLITACSDCNCSKNANPLPPAIAERIYNILLARNANIAIKLIGEIEADILKLQPIHVHRVNRVRANKRFKPTPI